MKKLLLGVLGLILFCSVVHAAQTGGLTLNTGNSAYLRRDGTNSPTAGIDFNGQNLTGVNSLGAVDIYVTGGITLDAVSTAGMNISGEAKFYEPITLYGNAVITAESYIQTSGTIWSLRISPEASANPDIFKIQADGSNWSGGNILRLRADDTSLRFIECDSTGASTKFRVGVDGTAYINGTLTMGNGTITTSSNTDLSLGSNGSGKITLAPGNGTTEATGSMEVVNNNIRVSLGDTSYPIKTRLSGTTIFSLSNSGALLAYSNAQIQNGLIALGSRSFWDGSAYGVETSGGYQFNLQSAQADGGTAIRMGPTATYTNPDSRLFSWINGVAKTSIGINGDLFLGSSEAVISNEASGVVKITSLLQISPEAECPLSTGTPEGTIWSDATTNKLKCYLGAAWNDLF